MSSRSNKEKNLKIVFFEHNPYMSVELLDLLNDYKIICYNDDATYRWLKEKWEIKSYLNTEFIEELESDEVAKILLGDDSFLQDVLHDIEKTKILFFYMNREMDNLRKKKEIKMLLPNFDLQEKLGNKIFFSKICEQLNLPQNKSLSFKEFPKNISDLFVKCKEGLGLPFVIQDSFGESGWDTSLISVEEELKEAKKKIKNELRATRYISNNVPVSVHVCILKSEIIIRGPWLQLVGLPELSLDPFRFTGNDTNQTLFTKEFIEEVVSTSKKISCFLQNEGYRGILGIDYLWDKNTNTVYPQEINSRLVGMTRLLTGIQKDQSIFPDLLKHIEAFDTPSLKEKCALLKNGEINLSNHGYSQIIIRNNRGEKVRVSKRLDPGIYKIKDTILIKTKQSLFVEDLEKDEVLIASAAHEGCLLCPGEVIVRILLKKSCIKNCKYALKEEVVELIDLIRAQIIVPVK